MEPQITEKQTWYLVGDSHMDRMWVPSDMADEETQKRREGYGYRFSAPGYTDATEWSVCESRAWCLRELYQRAGEDEEMIEKIDTLADRILSDTRYRVDKGKWSRKDGEREETIAVVYQRGNDRRSELVVLAYAGMWRAYIEAVERAESADPQYGGLEG